MEFRQSSPNEANFGCFRTVAAVLFLVLASGFAVPVDAVNRTATESIRHGRLNRPGLGIVADDRIPRRRGIDGVLIVNVVPGSAAEKAGLQGTMIDRKSRIQLGDIITKLGGEEIPDTERFPDALDQFEIGDKVKVTIQRNGEKKEISVALQER